MPEYQRLSELLISQVLPQPSGPATFVAEYDHAVSPVFTDTILTWTAQNAEEITEHHATVPFSATEAVANILTAWPGILLPIHAYFTQEDR